MLGIALPLVLGVTMRAQGGGGGGGGGTGETHVGDVLGDLIHIKRDVLTGQPILQKRWVELPQDQFGWDYCPIPVDAAGLEVPFAPLSCDPDPAYLDALVEVDYFGRLSGGRTQERNLRMHMDESINGIKAADLVTLDEAGRLRLGTDCTIADECSSWRTIDSPMENLSLYRWVMKYGHLQTDPLEEDTSMGGDPAAGTVYHPALDATDWAKFRGAATALLPRADASQCFTGSVFNTDCALPQPLTATDFFLAGGLLGGAADKTGKITPDLVQYLNRILKITQDTDGSLATVNTLPALIRDEEGNIAPAPDGLPWPANERFVDFAAADYLRSDWFSKSIYVLQLIAGGLFAPTNVDLMTWLNFINGPMTTRAHVLAAFIAESSDALRTVQFLHEYEIPADLWAGPVGTTTAVEAVTAGYNSVDQTVTLRALITSQNQDPVNSGTVTFSVRTATSEPVGVPVTSPPVADGVATAAFTLPGGTTPQVLTIVAVFTPSGVFATSQGVGFLTVVPAPTVTTVMPAAVPATSEAQVANLLATVTAGAGDTVNEGALLFTLRDTNNNVIGTPVATAVVGGAAAAPYTVPGGLAPQRLTILGEYQGTANYATSSGTNLLAVGCQPLTIMPQELPEAVLGQPYSQTFTSDGVSPVIYSLVGALPDGLVLTDGVLSGLPTAGGTVTFTINALDAAGCTGSRTYELEVYKPWAMVTGSGLGMEGLVKLFDADGNPPAGYEGPTEYTPFPGLTTGVRVAQADLTGDGVPDTIVGAGPGGQSRVVVIDGVTGAVIRNVQAFTQDAGGGVFVAAGDVNKDGVPDIVAGLGLEVPPVPPAGTIGKRAPANGVTDLTSVVALEWSSLPNAGYSVCWDTTNDNACSGTWWPNGGGTTRLLSGLAPGTYYWQVRAMTAAGTSEADAGTWWSFTVAAPATPPPAGTLGKLAPANGSVGLTSAVQVAWSSVADAGYWLCWDTTNNNTCDGTWWPNGGGTSRVLTGLAPGTYYWQVRAQTASGTSEADGGAWWTFTVGAPPRIRVLSGVDMSVLADFSAGTDFGGGGVRVAVGDVNGDGYGDIFAASGPGVPPVARVFSGASGAVLLNKPAAGPAVPGGLFIAAGDVSGDGVADLVVGAAEGGSPEVRVFDGVTLETLRSFVAFEPTFTGGVRVASADVNGDGRAEIIVASGPGRMPEVRVYDGLTGSQIGTFLAYPAGFMGGVYVAAWPLGGS